MRRLLSAALVALPLLVASGCNQSENDQTEEPTKPEYIAALNARNGSKLDMPISGAIEAFDGIADIACRSLAKDGADTYVREHPRTDSGADYGTRFRCPQLREAYLKAGGYVLKVPVADKAT